MIPRESTPFALAIFAAFVCVAEGQADIDLSCKIKKRQSAPMVGLSQNAMDSIDYKGSQTSSNFQVLDCTCDGDDDEVNKERADGRGVFQISKLTLCPNFAIGNTRSNLL